jgi:hypothetical protein
LHLISKILVILVEIVVSSCQYKNRHCFGNLKQSLSDLGYSRLVRNFFETSHAKGPQDTVGGLIKHQTDFLGIGLKCMGKFLSIISVYLKSRCLLSEDLWFFSLLEANTNKTEQVNFPNLTFNCSGGKCKRNISDDPEIPLCELISKNTIFAVLCDDESYDY